MKLASTVAGSGVSGMSRWVVPQRTSQRDGLEFVVRSRWTLALRGKFEYSNGMATGGYLQKST